MERIVAAALRITDAHGLEALSMRKLGAELGVDPMAIYRHLPNKDALLNSLVSAVFSRMELNSDPQAPWRERVNEWACAYRDLILSHPAFIRQVAANATMARAASGATIEPLRSALVDAGLPDTLVKSTVNTLVDFLHGYGLAATGGAVMGQSPSLPEGLDGDTLSKTNPRTDHRDLEQSFAVSLNIILEGALSLKQDHAAIPRAER
ncbi:TetR/AcrR family transcriptional regulator [Rhizobium puerariae]|uniref:TetR/AcrR family transcriptional regulator n=1 Tax=Rhizobium puerariae TaxID=1585791 RepID=A0ABV6ALY5_9HYPH